MSRIELWLGIAIIAIAVSFGKCSADGEQTPFPALPGVDYKCDTVNPHLEYCDKNGNLQRRPGK